MQIRHLSFTLALSLLVANPVWSKTELTLHGTLINLDCKIGDAEKRDINFGDEVVAEALDGTRYAQSMHLQIDCGTQYTGRLKFSVMGTESGFENTAVKTNIENLGIRFMYEESPGSGVKPMELNKPYYYKPSDSITLVVAPVKAPKATLIGGKFEATATLTLEPE